MLDFLHKYQEELFDEKRRKDILIKEMELRQKEIHAFIDDAESKFDAAFVSLSPLPVDSLDTERIGKLKVELEQVEERLKTLRVEYDLTCQRITKVQNLLIDMSEWKFEAVPTDEVSPEERYGEELVQKTDELLFGQSSEEGSLLAQKLQQVYDDIATDPDLARAELKGIINYLMK